MNFTKGVLQSLFIILVSLQITYSQDSSFVVGVWTTMGPNASSEYPDPPDSTEVKSLGVDLVLHTAIPQYSNYLSNFDKIIAVNAYEETDYIHTYSGAYYSRWECEEDQTIANIPGIKHDSGTREGSAWYCDTTNAEIGDLVITGPDYDQDKRYRFYFYSNTIDYEVKFRIKIGQSTQDHDSVCVISVRYETSDSRDTVLAYKTIYSDSLSTSYQDFTLEYSIPDTIDSKSIPLPSVSPEAIGLTSELGVEKSANAHGVQFNVMYLGKHALYFDYIEVFDSKYWAEFLDDPTTIADEIIFSANRASSLSNLEYWYSLDEPKTIDNYEPYRIVDSILQSATEKPLITSYYPEWDGKRNNEPSMKKFVDIAEPSRLMFYYYPYSPSKKNVDGLRFQQLASDYNFRENDYKDHYFLAQAHGFWKDKDTWEKRRPIPSELNASCMLALSYGAKGLLFWHYLTYMNEDGSIRNYGLVDSSGQKTDLWYHIRDNIVPRLHGTLGNTLMDLKYKGDYEYMRKNFNGLASDSTDNTDLIISTFSSDSVHIHIGELIDETVSDTKYYMLANLICGDSTLVDSVNLGLDFSQLSYNNYLFASVEGEDSLNCCFHNGSSQKFKFHAGQGVLFKLGPVLKYGGYIVGSDTVSTSISLVDSMTIKNSATLTISSTYSLHANIFIENGGYIEMVQGGILAASENNYVNISCWSDTLLKARTTGTPHPRIFWGEHSLASFYQIHRKYGTSPWQIVDTVYSGEVRVYTDTNVTISSQVAGVEMKYFVTAVYFAPRETANYDSSDVVDYNVYGGEIEKRLVEGEEENLLPKEYLLLGNFPNPFNPSTTIKYGLPEISDIRIEIFDITGRLVKEFKITSQSEGYKEIVWNGDNDKGMKVSSGIYIMRFNAAEVKGHRSFLKSHKLVLVK